MKDVLVTLRQRCPTLTAQRGVLEGGAWDCRYSTIERMQSMAQAYQCTERPCPIESPRTALFWSLRVRDTKVDRMRLDRGVSDDLS